MFVLNWHHLFHFIAKTNNNLETEFF